MKHEPKTKWKINKCDEHGNIITGYEEVLTGHRSEVIEQYRSFHEYLGCIFVEKVED